MAGAGNDPRLGPNEAAPAVISIYVGDQLAEVLAALEASDLGTPRRQRGARSQSGASLRLGVDTLPPLPKDATDRNRTSPFAFTGNKFEFRAPGSSVCCSGPMTVLNTIVAEAVDRIAGELEAAKVAGKAKPGEHTAAFHNALQKILQASLKEHKRVVFNGNGYEADWPKEAARRGLPNAPDTPSALAALAKKENAALFAKYGVMTARELESRREIALENYTTKVMIEGNAALDLARTMFIPVVKTEYRDTLAAYGESEKHGIASGTASLHEELVTLGAGMDAMRTHCAELEDALGNQDAADVIAAMLALRTTVDSLERIIDNSKWPLPKYREMLFLY